MTAHRPNFIVVFMDDMGYGDMSCFGSRSIRTPNMDAVAHQGARFNAMYSAAAICTPSRAALLTGRQPQRLGLERVLFPEDAQGIPEAEATLAEDLRQCGYRTMMAGKWHVGCRPEHNPLRHGFDDYIGLLYSNDMDPLHLYDGETVAEEQVDQAKLTRQYTDRVIQFIEESGDRPFLAYLAHTMPHIPLHVEEEFRGISPGGIYGDTIECIDFHLGRILQRLDDLDLAERTFIVVTSDNGPWFEGSTGGLRGRKFDVFEGGVRMPFVARYPGVIPERTVCEEPASLMDLLPTLVGLAGGAVPEERRLDGVDILPAFRGEAMPARRPLFFYQHYALNAVRDGRWKLHVASGNEGQNRKEMPLLFDLEIDPGESYNLARDHPDVVSGLIDQMTAHHESVLGDAPVEVP
jgi:uncharacterized sulfatase